MLSRLWSALTGSAATAAPAAPPSPDAASTSARGAVQPPDQPAPEPTVRRVLVVVYDPMVGAVAGGAPGHSQKLSRSQGWDDPYHLAVEDAADVREARHGMLDYQVVARVERDAFYPLADGYTYDAETYLRCWRTRSGFH